MDIKIKGAIHNRFDVFRKDIRTGVEEQVAYAENIILDRLWTRDASKWQSLEGCAVHFAPVCWFFDVTVGRGTGELSPARSSLFSEIFVQTVASNGTYAANAAEGWTSCTRSITRTETQDVGEVYTEVGIRGHFVYYDEGLLTHALLMDMNGNPTSIEKKSTDIITFYVTWFFYLPVTSFYDGGVIFSSPSHTFFNQINGYNAGEGSWSKTVDFYCGLPHSSQVLSRRNPDWLYQQALTPTWTGAEKKMALSGRLAVGSGNGVGTLHGIAHIRHSSCIMKLNLPIDPVPQTAPWIEESDIVGEPLGSGDGIKTGFLTYYPFAKAATVKVDGIAVDSGDVEVKELMPNYIYCDPWFVYDSVADAYKNPFYETLGIKSVYLSNNGRVEASLDGTTWVTVASRTSGSGTQTINATYRQYPYWRRISVSSLVTDSYAFDVASIDDLPNVVFDSPPGLVTGEAIGIGDGTEISFALDHEPIAESLTVYLNGIETTDYTVADGIINFTSAPGSGVAITADYRFACSITIDYTTPVIAKDANHVFDFYMAYVLGEYVPE